VATIDPVSELVQGTVTVLFTDLEGSTDLRTRLGDDAAQTRIRAHENLIREQVGAAGGSEAKFLGDGFMIVFSSARQAINCAVSIQRAIDEHNRENADTAFRVRIGINTGEVTKEGEDLYGAAVNAASRICDKGQGGQILIPQVVRDLAGFLPDLRVVDRGLFWLKGFPNRWRLYEVMWREKGAAREETETVRPLRRPPQIADLPRAQAPVVGRAAELAAIEDELEEVQAGTLRAVSVEGEAGIGKTRLLEAAASSADRLGFGVLRAAADEDLRGPFLLCRTLFASPAVEAIAERAVAQESVERARDAIAGRRDQRHEALTPQEQVLLVFDEVTNAIRSLASEAPLALLLDDVQWADDDSLRLIKYVVRTIAPAPVLLFMTVRPETEGSGGGVGNLIADLERMHMARRLRLRRFGRGETAELLKNLLAGPLSPKAIESLHARAEGVPFFIEEFARAYRESGVLQAVDGTWTMTQITGPQVPASVQTLIERRLAQLGPELKTVLADAAILGRQFRVSELAQLLAQLGSSVEKSVWELAESVEPALALGIVTELPEGSRYDYAFTHDQIRAALAEGTSRQRRRAIHGAIAKMLAETSEEGHLSALAHHALQAGDEKLGLECSIRAARESLEAHAPEESVRICDAARAAASEPEVRAELLRIKDEALAVLERGEERTANLAEMGALASAIGDPGLQMEVQLRRASAAMMTADYELAGELAAEIRRASASQGDAPNELAACLELGQALMRSPLGEGFVPMQEVDLDKCWESFERAAEIARGLGDSSRLAASLRELGVIQMGRARMRALEVMGTGAKLIQEVMFDAELQGLLSQAKDLIGESLRIYEELGDRRGAMSSLISLAYAHVTDFTRRGEAGRLEQIRRLHSNLKRMTSEREWAEDEVQMLYSIHLYARSHLILDLALERGREAYGAARSLGDRMFEFLSAGGIAATHIILEEVEEADAWLERAAQVALASPRPLFSRRLATWRGLLSVAAGDPDGMSDHLERAVNIASDQGSPAGRCESLALLAMESAKFGTKLGDDRLLDRALAAADEARALVSTLPGQLAWEAQAWGGTCLVALAREDKEAAADAARSALEALTPRLMQALYLDVLWAAARALIPGGAPEGPDLIAEITEDLVIVDQSMVDPRIKRRWIEIPIHKELAEITGYNGFVEESGFPQFWQAQDMEELEVDILKGLTAGRTDAEIAVTLGTSEQELTQQMETIFSKLGVDTRSAATERALRAGII